jgi:anti-anti-sigma factor
MWNIAEVDAVRHPAFLVRAEPDTGTLRLFGELDVGSAPDLLRAATERLHCYQSINVDLTELMFIDAAGLGALVTLSNRCQASGTHLSVTGAPDHIARVFTIAGLADLHTSSQLATVTPLIPTPRSEQVAATTASRHAVSEAWAG